MTILMTISDAPLVAVVTTKTADGYTAEFFDPAKHQRSAIDVINTERTGEWIVTAKNFEQGAQKVNAALQLISPGRVTFGSTDAEGHNGEKDDLDEYLDARRRQA